MLNTQRFLLIISRRMCQSLAAILFFLVSTATFAATYTFPGSLPSGCTGSSGTYTCSSGLTLGMGDSIVIASPKPATINITGNFTTGSSNNINTAGAASDLTINVTGTLTAGFFSNIKANVTAASVTDSGLGSVTFGGSVTSTGAVSLSGGNNTISGALSTTTGNITLGSSNNIGGNISSTSGSITTGMFTTISGSISTSGTISIGSGNNITGAITGTTGNISIGSSTTVSSSITSSSGTISLGSSSTASSCVRSTSSSSITLGMFANVNSICCGSGSCGTSCVSNGSFYTMPATCTTSEAIVVNAKGTPDAGVYPVMELWINQVKVGSVNITSSTYADYTFYTSIPSGAFKLDIVYQNDTSTRELFVSGVTVRGKTFFPTDSGVIIDKGSGSTAIFDGVDTITGQSSISWDAALRFTADFSSASSYFSLVSYYQMEEASWSGTSGELKDNGGNSNGPFNGTGAGSPLPTAATSSPAISGTSGTCGYATFSGSTGGSAFTTSNLRLSTISTAETSVSFWMYWDGTNNVFPIGFNRYGLVISNNRFGFNTMNSDVYGISATSLTNGWYHIAAVFVNGSATSNKLYINGVLQTLTQLIGTPNNTSAVVSTSLNIGGIGIYTNDRFNGGRLDEVKVYNGEISQAQVTADYSATHTCTGNLIAYYNMDESSWNGTSGELKDTAGATTGTYNGTGIGTPVPTAAYSSRAISGTTGTCGYATFSGSVTGGSAFTIPSLPVSTTAGEKTSVSFWIYWDGTNGILPIGWNKYALMFSGSHFGFNTDAGDLYGTSTTGLANGWHHVVAVFTNGGVTSNKLYIDGVSKTLTQRIGTPNNTNAVVQSTFQVSGYAKNTNYRFSGGRIDEARIYKGEISSTQVTTDYAATHACPSYVTNTNASSFNCIASQESSVSAGRLYTQMAGNAFAIKVIALQSGGTTAETSFSTASARDVTLKFIDQTNASAITFNDGSSNLTSKTLTFPAADTTGILSVSSLTISQAYANLKCQITDATASVTASSVDSFAVRPYQFVVTSSNANGDNNGTSISALSPIKAGANFNLTATAVNASGTTLTGYTGTPSVTTSSISAHSGAVTTGSLSSGFSSAATSGVASGNFTYGEVGYFRLNAGAVTDTGFVGTVDSSANGDCTNDFSVTAVSGKYGCKVQNISASNYYGRFIPDHFAITPGTATAGCSSFTYFGQDGLTTPFTLTAQNAANATTQNYTGSFAKLGLTSWSNFTFTAATLPSGAALSGSATTPTGSWNNGLASVSAKHIISRPTSATAPTSITISAAPADSDGVTTSSTAVANASNFRYGRLWMSNTYGSELLNLTVPIEAQYWSSNGVYQRNQLDSCTSIAPANIAMANYKSNLAACETVISGGGTLATGKTTMTLSKPGNDNNGSVDLSLNLNSAAGSTCISTSASSATNANLPQFGTSNPSARETFGIFKSPVIYMRENY